MKELFIKYNLLISMIGFCLGMGLTSLFITHSNSWKYTLPTAFVCFLILVFRSKKPKK